MQSKSAKRKKPTVAKTERGKRFASHRRSQRKRKAKLKRGKSIHLDWDEPWIGLLRP